jgi:ribosomal protein S18 acetylase RimI-like enzyme
VWAERLRAPEANQFVVVAEVSGCTAGFACVFAENHAGWGSYLENLHVSTTFQGRGIGSALLGEVARWCESRRAGGGLYLSVNQDNCRAQRFYLRHGARNAEPGVWSAPDGSSIPTFWFTWSSAASLVKARKVSR